MVALDLFDVSGETVFITGGGTGLGKRFAKTLALRGAKVIICGRRADKLETTVNEIKAAQGDAHFVTANVSDAHSVQQAFVMAQQIATVTVVINNAGVGADKLLKDADEEQWDTVMDTNLKGAWMVSREAVRSMIANNCEGCIINISSVLGASVQQGTGPYCAAKAGLSHLTRAMAVEWARHNVRVNGIAPGYFYTDMAAEFLDSAYGEKLTKKVPMKRLGREADLDGVLLFLASRASAYLTGTVIPVDGGLSISVI